MDSKVFTTEIILKALKVPWSIVPTSFKVTNLRSFRSSSINTGAFDTGTLPIVICNLLNLLSELSSWSKHQSLQGQKKNAKDLISITQKCQKKNTKKGLQAMLTQ